MVKTFAEALIGAEADALRGTAFRERTMERANCRNGSRERPFGCARRDDPSAGAQGARRHLLPRLAAGAPQAG